MNPMMFHYRFILLLLSPFVLIFGVLHLTSTISSLPKVSLTTTTTTTILQTVLSNRTRSSTATSSTTTSTSTGKKKVTKPKCKPFTALDTRPFFDREPPQKNLPQSIKHSDRSDLLRRLRSLRLAVVACAFNVEKDVDKFRAHVEPIVDLFHPSSRIMILESDSTDGTLAKLRQWTRPELYTYGNLSVPVPIRTERIAYCRNELLKKARQMQPDYMLVLDLDIFATNVSSFLTNFDYHPEDWSVMTANLIQKSYYDIWALRTYSETIMNYDCWHRIWALLLIGGYCEKELISNVVEIHQKPFPMDRGLLEVRSAFGGAGLYKMEATEGCEYSGHYYTCEHAPFHQCMRDRNQARVFINPEFTQ